MAAARKNEIGRVRCPICGSKAAALRVSAKQLAYVCCDACNVQVFARSDRSDDALRRLPLTQAEPAQEAPEPKPAAPAAAAPAPKPAAPPDQPKPEPAPTKPRASWGAFPMFGG